MRKKAENENEEKEKKKSDVEWKKTRKCRWGKKNETGTREVGKRLREKTENSWKQE